MVLAPLTVCIEPRMPPRAPRGWKRESNPKVAQKFRTPDAERRSASGLTSGLLYLLYMSLYMSFYIAITALGLRENEA